MGASPVALLLLQRLGGWDAREHLGASGCVVDKPRFDHGTLHHIGLLHAVTAPLACELVLPWLAEEDRDAALSYVWQAAAALHVAYDIDRTAPAPTDAPPGPADLVDAALASGDEHAIKLTEAALRTFARSGAGVVLLAAADACARL